MHVREEERRPRAVHAQLVEGHFEHGRPFVGGRARVDDQRLALVEHDEAVRGARGHVLERHPHLEHVGIAVDLVK